MKLGVRELALLFEFDTSKTLNYKEQNNLI